jgi:hypothetical protein
MGLPKAVSFACRYSTLLLPGGHDPASRFIAASLNTTPSGRINRGDPVSASRVSRQLDAEQPNFLLARLDRFLGGRQRQPQGSPGRQEVWMRRVVGDPVKRIMEINLYGGIDWILDS